MKILILALSGIGDALMYTPSLVLIRKHFPDAQVDAIVMYKGVEDIYKRSGLVDSVMYFDFIHESPLKSLAFILRLRGSYEYSINVYPANRKEYNVINLLVGAPKRGGVQYLRQNFKNLGFLNNVRITENDSLHNVEENILLTKKLLGFADTEMPPFIFKLLPDDLQFAETTLRQNNISADDLVIGFHAGCSTLKNHSKRRWEVEKFVALGKKLIAENNAKILLFGGPEETELKQEIVDGISSPHAMIIDAKNLAQSAALIGKCNVFVTNDSSLMHVASAMQVKVVAVIGPTNPAYIHPWQTEHTIVSLHLDCAPCFVYSPKPLSCSRTDVQFKCIKELGVDLVYEAVRKYIER